LSYAPQWRGRRLYRTEAPGVNATLFQASSPGCPEG